jgi:hypothetical protein
MPQVTELGKALTSDDLKGRTFILSGFIKLPPWYKQLTD